ncbi:MAG: hypothetical protein IKO00_04120, partial [Oscillospiraceae bacterium]|nr:hypothetical protein [Oscillospiraceae bacterium]
RGVWKRKNKGNTAQSASDGSCGIAFCFLSCYASAALRRLSTFSALILAAFAAADRTARQV